MSETAVHDAHEDDDYRGAAVLVTGDQEIDVELVLRGHFQPIDGRFHWYGRVAAHPAVSAASGGRKCRVVVRTPCGEAEGVLSDPDPWDRHRISGVGRPPFELDTDLEASA